MATATIRTRQAIPVITNAAAPEHNLDEVSTILAILDAALEAYQVQAPLRAKLGYWTSPPRGPTFFTDTSPHAEYAMLLWASARCLDVARKVNDYGDKTMHVLRIVTPGDREYEIATLQWPMVPKPAEPSWRPADVVEQPVAEVTAPAIRDALAKPHWTDEKTLTDEERAMRERMEAGHA